MFLSPGSRARPRKPKPPTIQTFTATGSVVYKVSKGAVWLEVFAVAGGGGGAGAGAANTTVAGSNGTTSAFGSVAANPGNGAGGGAAVGGTAGGAGGTGGTGTATRRMAGTPGLWGLSQTAIAGYQNSGPGGSSVLRGGGGLGLIAPGVGNAGAANTGGGGGGAVNSPGAANCGAGGGGAESFYLIVNFPASTYNITVGTGGAGGVSTNNGGAGADGWIQIIEHYG
jgi:hypothetical protein